MGGDGLVPDGMCGRGGSAEPAARGAGLGRGKRGVGRSVRRALSLRGGLGLSSHTNQIDTVPVALAIGIPLFIGLAQALANSGV